MFPGSSRSFNLPGVPGDRSTSTRDTFTSASEQEEVP